TPPVARSHHHVADDGAPRGAPSFAWDWLRRGPRIVVHLLWESNAQHAGMEDTAMKRHRHTPEQVVRKLREGERMLIDGKDLVEVLRHLEVSESSWNRWRTQYGGMKATEAKRLRELEI